MSMLRAALPRLAAPLVAPRLAAGHAPLLLQFAKASPASTLRSLSTSSRPSIIALLPKRFGSATGALRSITTQPVTAYEKAAPEQVDWQKVATSVGLAALVAAGLHFALNRETRDSLNAVEADYLNDTFKWTGLGLGITAITAKLMHQNGGAYRLMAMNPWLVMGGGLVLSLGSMYGVFATAPDSPAHYLSWAVFTATQGVTLSPMFFLNPAVLARAGLYTAGAFGGLSYIGATARNDQYLYIGGPLLAGLGVIILSNLAPMLMPRMAFRTMSILEHVAAYGGVAVFSGFILMDTQKIIRHAKLAETGVVPRDPIRESVSLVLDVINLFVSFVRVLLLQQGGRRK